MEAQIQVLDQLEESKKRRIALYLEKKTAFVAKVRSKWSYHLKIFFQCHYYYTTTSGFFSSKKQTNLFKWWWIIFRLNPSKIDFWTRHWRRNSITLTKQSPMNGWYRENAPKNIINRNMSYVTRKQNYSPSVINAMNVNKM